jgi:hypothetical protein
VAITSLLFNDYNSSWARQITKKPTAKSLINCMMKEEENRKTEGANQ